MAKAIRLEQTGGPEVMKYVDVEVGAPGPGEVQVRHRAIGLNFIDIYVRSGMYATPLPSGLGTEGAGDVTAVGPGVTGFKVGDRVAYAGGPQGSYSELRNMPAAPLVKLPKSIDYETAAAMMLKGMTVQYLLRRTYKVQKGQTILFHAAAGGVGLIAMQWAKALGVTVIGTVGSPEKAALAVGKDTFQASLDSLQPFGLMVSFGNASGPVPPVALVPALKGSLYITRPSLVAHTGNRANLEEIAGDLMRMVSSGKVKIEIDQRYPLAQAAQAHVDLAARKTTGSTVLIP